MNASGKNVGHLPQGFKVAKFQGFGFGCSGEGRNYPTQANSGLEWGTRLGTPVSDR